MENRLLDFITRLNGTDSFVTAWQVYSEELASVGINQSLYGFSIMLDGKRTHDDFLFLSNYSEGFLREYNGNQMGEHDVMVDWCEQYDTPLEWNSTPFNLTKEQKALEELSADYQVMNGFSIPLKLLHGQSWGGVGLSATGISRKEFEADIKPHYEYIQLIVQTFHMFVQKFPRFTEAHSDDDHVLTALTKNEIETLRWLTHGYSIDEIAHKKLFRSVPMVNKYINRAKQKLNAKNRDQLIAKAIILGLL